jgi:hypothetical protein
VRKRLTQWFLRTGPLRIDQHKEEWAAFMEAKKQMTKEEEK